MIIWGGFNRSSGVFNTGGRYTPSSDSWIAISTTNAPGPRGAHTAVWTGSEMIVWGGNQNPLLTNTGGRYTPSSDSWTATSTTNAPDPRNIHTAIWTGSEMIVWGGHSSGDADFNTGGRYAPSGDRWTATSTTNAPDARFIHTAVWTGSEMIVWGGLQEANGNGLFFNTGGRYCAHEECTLCHKHTQTLVLPCDSPEYLRHLDHGDTAGPCSIKDGRDSDARR